MTLRVVQSQKPPALSSAPSAGRSNRLPINGNRSLFTLSPSRASTAGSNVNDAITAATTGEGTLNIANAAGGVDADLGGAGLALV